MEGSWRVYIAHIDACYIKALSKDKTTDYKQVYLTYINDMAPTVLIEKIVNFRNKESLM